MKFEEAMRACQDEGAVLAMPRTVEDISDIKQYDREYNVFQYIFVQNRVLQ